MRVWKPFSYSSRPHETISGASIPARVTPVVRNRAGSTPFGTIVTLSRGSWNARTTSSTMKPEQQITRWAS
jgi:hypothetical protein